MSSSREFCTIAAGGGINLDARIYKPEAVADGKGKWVIVLVHPYSVLGGCQGLLKGIAVGLANRGFIAITFDMRGVGKSTGRSSLTGFSEVNDVVSVCKWASQNLSADRILLLGSSAGTFICYFGFWIFITCALLFNCVAKYFFLFL